MADDGTLTKDEIDEIAGKVGNIVGIYLDDDDAPDSDAVSSFVAELNTKNPYRVVYNMVLGATVKTAIGAKKFSDDGVSLQLGTGLSSLERVLPFFKQEMERWDADNGESYLQFEYPDDYFSEKLTEYGL